jgi:hypothetical protein
VALAGFVELVGFSLSFFAVCAYVGGFRLNELFCFLAGPLVMLWGIALYHLRKWAWVTVVGVFFVLAALFCSDATIFLLHPDGKERWDGSIYSAVLILGSFPFLFYYLVRFRTRVRFGIGSKLPE